MKYLVTIFVFLNVLSTAISQIVDTININKIDNQGRKQGLWKKYEDTTLKYVGYFKDDKPIGTFNYYYPDKKIKSISVYSNNGSVARVTMFHLNGKKSAEGVYRDEKKDSIWNYYNENEELISVESYANGLKNGISKIYYPGSNVLAEEINWKYGNKDGKWTQYFTTGNVKLIANYKNGKLNGKVTLYYLSGKVKYYGEYIDSKKQGTWVYMKENGSIIKKEIYNNGYLTKIEYYDKEAEKKDNELKETLQK